MFILSTTHVALAVSELLQGFVFEGESTPGGPAAFYRINVFPKRKAIYIVNVRPFFHFHFHFSLYFFPVSFVYFLVLHVFENADYFTAFFFLNFYNLDASRRLPPGTSFFILLSNKQILIPVPEILIWVRSGGYMLYTVVTGLYAFLVYVQRPFIYNPFH